MTRRRVALDTLVFDVELWPRILRDDARIEQLADVLRAGKELPPIKVQQGTGLVLGGWHTAAACRQVGETSYFVEEVDVPPNERLLYAYSEDVTSALAYSDADVKSVAERLYRQRSSDGNLPNVSAIATDLGRSQRTVAQWLAPLVQAREGEVAIKRGAQIIAVQAFRKTGLSLNRTAAVMGLSHTQVVRDSMHANADYLTDSRIVSDAHSLIHLALGNGATTAEMEAARDWLIGQTNPSYLEEREERRVWLAFASTMRDVREQLETTTIPKRPVKWDGFPSLCADLQQMIGSLETVLHTLNERITL